MALRTARQGRKAGSHFWGCTRFPDCRGTRDAEDQPPITDVGPTAEVKAHSLAALPVSWQEGVRRLDFVSEYVSVGAMPGLLREQLHQDKRLEQALSQCIVLSGRGRSRHPSDHARFVSALLVKVLQRGRTPLPTLEVEREALRAHGLMDEVQDLEVEGHEVGWELRPGVRRPVTPENVLAVLAERKPFVLDPAFSFAHGSETGLLGSDAEMRFLDGWVPDVLGPSAGHWFTPQAPLDKLLESSGEHDDGSARRVDFLFDHPGGSALAIEIDGSEHGSSELVDKLRDESLHNIGIDVLRVSNEEVVSGSGKVLDEIRRRCEGALTACGSSSVDRKFASFVIDCAVAAKVQFAIARAIAFGWLTADEVWRIDLVGAGSVAAQGVRDILRLLGGFDALYDGCSVPVRCTVRADDGFTVTEIRDVDGGWRETADCEAQGEDLRIVVESTASPFHQVHHDERTDFMIRPAYVPAAFATENTFDFERKAIALSSYDQAQAPLKTFLQNIFRKFEFRANQGEAIFNILRQNDCVVLLPTGAGKSLIYQLAGLLMPGITLVVDPLVSLIEDQVEGLQAYGIDRAAPIARSLATPTERKHVLLRVERGEYQFVLLSPERLQSPHFRSTLRALAEISLVNLAVIDEAHCVSDWGHDFRPAYLNLANNLRRFCADREKNIPPLLALTGTASRVVLIDMLTVLDIDRNRSDALIRPESFDRPELHFEIVRTSPSEDVTAALRGVLNKLPAKFGLPRTEFFHPSGRSTASGIVFVPTVNGRVHGVDDARAAARTATGAQVTVYSGLPPRSKDKATWDAVKRENARQFKRNRAPVLVATKAFGMGIDKPNIRWTVHFGMPSSLEGFYQEAGRAGRDRQSARCVMVFSEYDANRSDELLDPDLDLETVRERFNQANDQRKTGDDVTLSLWFHLQSFSGAYQELGDVEGVLKEMGKLSARRLVELPFESEQVQKERAIHRLLRIGVIDDYEVDYGSRKFNVHVKAFDLGHCKKKLFDHIHTAQPAKSKIVARRLEQINKGRPFDLVSGLARILIEFTYDVIERSRRRMIQESVLLARRARNDAEIRVRLLDYLQEGIGAERIAQLLDDEEIDLSAWSELVHKVQTPMDAGELRGLCIRALESYPDHPGLLLARAVAESMCSDHDDRVSSRGIGASMRKGIHDYQLAQEDVAAVIDGLFDLAHTRAPGLGLPLTVALLDLDSEGTEFEHVLKRGRERARGLADSRVSAAMTAQILHGMVHRMESAVDRVIQGYGARGVARALGGVSHGLDDRG